MTITLGTLTLNQHISRRNWWNEPNISGDEIVTIGGRTVVTRYNGNINGDIILEAIEEDNIRKGYFTKSDLIVIDQYRASGEQIILDYHGEQIPVIIKRTGVLVEKTLWKSQDTDNEKYIGRITLKRV